MNFPAKTPSMLMALAPGLCWHMPRGEKTLYLTFDDGPHETLTQQVLDLLAGYDAKATFFCVGENVERHPEVVRATLAAGHAVGNHTHNHLNGWKTDRRSYLRNIELAENALLAATGQASVLFRPPYGRLNLAAWRSIAKRYKVVMWDVAAGDFVQDWPVEQVKGNVVENAQTGSVVVLHDSMKCAPRMLPTLEATLETFSQRGYAFKAIPGR